METTPKANLHKHYVIHTMLGHGAEHDTEQDEKQDEVGYESSVALPPRSQAPPAFVARRLELAGAFAPIDLQVSPGECLGLYGFVGAGHQELAHALAGALRPTSGEIVLDGRRLKPGSTHQAVRRGVVLVAADRGQTLVHQAEIHKNVTLAHLRKAVGQWLTGRKERRVAQPLLESVRCRPADSTLPVGKLSGGNQQKVVLAKWLLGPVRVLALDEPTRGMDVGAKAEIMRLVADLKRKGAAVVLASSEPEMLLAHADRILVMNRGRVAHEFCDTQLDKETLMRYA